MKAIGIYLWGWLLPLLGVAQGIDSSSCLRLNGLLIDQITNQPVGNALVFAKTLSGRIKIGTSDEAGKFQAIVPCEAASLFIERTAYRAQTLAIQQPLTTSKKEVPIIIPLLSTDKQERDKPYLQTEQTSYIQQNGTSVQSASLSQPTTFSVVDALHGKSLTATICLFFTRTGEKKCITTNDDGLANLNLDKRDIVALEINSEGYQTYAGNLIIDQLDSQPLRHTIRLQRELTILTVRTDNASQCSVQMGDKLVSLAPMPNNVSQFVAYMLIPGRYKLLVTTKTNTIHRFIQLKKGLNIEEVRSSIKPAIATATSKMDGTIKSVDVSTTTQPTLLLPGSIPMIYFQQGSYQLRVDSQEVLRQVATYLKTHPSYTIQITGHTDNVGDERLNLNLSLDRAKVTSNFLNGQGIHESRLIQTGFGGKYPLVPNDSETSKALNRRVALTLITAQ